MPETDPGRSVHDLGMSRRTSNALARAGLNTLAELGNATEQQLRALPHFGDAAIADAAGALARHGRRFTRTADATDSSPKAAGQGPEKIDGRCNARTRGSGLCKRGAGQSTEHPGIGNCNLHGGSTPNHIRAAEKVIAVRAVATYGLPIEIDPREALVQEVYRTAGHVAYLADRVRAIDPDDLVWGKTSEADQQATEFPGVNTTRESKPNVWLVLYLQERKHLVDVCKTALAAGVEERRVKLAEQMGSQLAGFVRFLLDGLNLSPDQWDLVPGLMRTAGTQLGLTAA